MRVALLNTQVPFVSGGAERHAARLAEALQTHGHEAVEVTLPFKWYPGATLARSILAAKLLDVSEAAGVPIDLAVGLRFPAWLMRHPNKAFWIIHQYRQAHDLWESGDSELLDDPEGAALRQTILAEDRAALGAGAPLFANSRNVAARLDRFLGLQAEPLYHPPPLADRLTPGETGDYIFAPGRITPFKRLDLMIEALAEAGRGPRLVVAGAADTPAYLDRLRALARERGVDDRIEWLGAIDDDTMIRRYSGARAVVFAPKDEDYGYITLEAMLSGKPVLTVTDAGGPLEFVGDGEEGLVAAPTPASLGRAFARVTGDAALAERMGAAGRSRYDALNLDWEHVIGRLLAGAPTLSHAPPPPAAPKTAPENAHREDAVARLRAAVAAPSATRLPVASPHDVAARFSFDVPAGADAPDTPPDDRLAAGIEAAWPRCAAAIGALDGLAPQTILDIGFSAPPLLAALLAARFPGARLLGLREGPGPRTHRIRDHGKGDAEIGVEVAAADPERDRWPWEDGSIDLVVGIEVLQHFALDPHHALGEANRILAPGGHLLLTTPNIASHRAVSRILGLEAPYAWGGFAPAGGVSARHNREYAPRELPMLGEAAGFATVSLSTHDMGGDPGEGIDLATAELLARQGQPLALRGETILYLGRKDGPPRGAPKRFYAGDPTRMAGRLALTGGPDPKGGAEIALTNTSTGWWTVEGPHRTTLLAEWLDAEGGYHGRCALPGPDDPVPPGATAHVRLAVDGAPEGSTPGRIRLHLCQEGAGPFTGTGRAAPLDLPCSREAFDRLGRPA